MFALLHPVSIREGLFRSNIGDARFATSPMAIFEENGVWNHKKFERAVICMEEHSLVRFSRQSGDEIVVLLHWMVSEWLRLRLDKSTLSTSLKMAALHLQNYVGSMELDHKYGQEALLHMDSICRIGEGESDGFLDIYFTFGRFYAKHGRLEDAERMYDRALDGYEAALGADHHFALDTVNNLGLLYVDQGRLADAERMYERALAGKERALGRDHTSTLDTIHNLGSLYRNQGRLVDAERMYQHALAGYEKAVGIDHSSTLRTVNNLGLLYVNQGRLTDAERMYERALAGKEKPLGHDHISTLDIHNLGNLYRNQGRLADAERTYQDALPRYEKASGADHSSTLKQCCH